jgi:hypothetical protein
VLAHGLRSTTAPDCATSRLPEAALTARIHVAR